MSIISSIRNQIARYVMPRVLLNWSDPNIVIRKREEKEKIRKKEGRPHEVFYFHELLDPYSHITAQILNKFRLEYSVKIIPMLVNEPPIKTVHEPSLYRKYCLTDAIRIASCNYKFERFSKIFLNQINNIVNEPNVTPKKT